LRECAARASAMRLSSNHASPEHSHLLLDLLYPPYCLYVLLATSSKSNGSALLPVLRCLGAKP